VTGGSSGGRDGAAASRGRRLALASAVLALAIVALWIFRPGAGSPIDPAPKAPSAGPAAPARPATPPRRVRPETAETPPAPVGTKPPSPQAPAEGSTSVSVEVVDERGERLSEGTVSFRVPDTKELMKRGMSPLRYLTDRFLADANPALLTDLPDDADGLPVEAVACAPGLASPPEVFTVALHRTTAVRLVAAKGGGSAEVRVVESDSEAPIAGATVVSLTELDRRGLRADELRGTPGPGSAVSGPDGRCVLTGLAGGTHAIEVDAPDHLRGRTDWTAGPLVVRLDRAVGAGSVTVSVTGPDGKPAAGIKVALARSGRTATTGADGRALLDSVPAGDQYVRLELPDGPGLDAWAAKMGDGLVMLAEVEVEPGGHYAAELGCRSGTAAVEGRLVTESGAPIASARVSAFVNLAIVEAVSDRDGVVRFANLPDGTIQPEVTLPSGEDWFVDSVDVAAGEQISRTWTIGSATLRVRVVRGAKHEPVAGARISASGPLHGFATSDAEGRFEFSAARAGRYTLDASDDDGGLASRRVDVVVPTDEEVVLEMLACGRVTVHCAAADRSLLREAKIELRSRDDGSTWGLRRDAGAGDLVAEDVLPGAYDVVVEVAGRSRSFAAEVKSGETAVVEVRAP
jgi:hypothetical protein